MTEPLATYHGVLVFHTECYGKDVVLLESSIHVTEEFVRERYESIKAGIESRRCSGYVDVKLVKVTLTEAE